MRSIGSWVLRLECAKLSKLTIQVRRALLGEEHGKPLKLESHLPSFLLRVASLYVILSSFGNFRVAVCITATLADFAAQMLHHQTHDEGTHHGNQRGQSGHFALEVVLKSSYIAIWPGTKVRLRQSQRSCIMIHVSGTTIFDAQWCRKFRSQTSDIMDRWKSRGGKSQGGEEKKWEDLRRERVRRKKMQVREKVGKSRLPVFFQWFAAPEGRRVGSLKRRVRSQLAKWEMKNCTPLWREAHFQVKI